MPTLLLVDDNADDVELARAALGAQALHLLRAASGEEALACLSRRDIDLVVTDLRMPGMDGLELTETLRAEYPLVPVVLLTGVGSEDIAAEALRRGASSFIPKRYLMRDLARTVENVLATTGVDRALAPLVHCTRSLESRHVLANTNKMVRPLVSYLQAYLVPLGICDEASCAQVGMALVEAITNAIDHGNLEASLAMRGGDYDAYRQLLEERARQAPYCERTVEVLARLTSAEAVYIVRDQGKGFCPLEVPDPTEPGHDERCGGRGLLLIRTFMDEVTHNEKGNEITMVKRASGAFRPAR